MANYSLVVNSKFRPFEYQELVAPVLLATQAHHELEDKYADLATKASIWDGLTEGSEKAHKMYTDYARALEEAADELSRYGLTPTSRQAMLNMWSRYGKEIAPIERAYELRSKDIERQKDAYDKSGGRTIFSRNAREISLDDYLNGASPEYSSVNLDNVVNTGIAGGKAISSRYINTEEGKRFNGDYYSLITETGMSPEQAMEVLRGSGKYPEFERFINDTLTNYGYDKYQGAEKEAIRRALNEGINIGITHSQTENLHENWRAKKAADYYYHELEAEAAANREINKAAQLAQIKASADRNDQINNMFAPAVPLGVTGEPDADLDRVKGLKLAPGINGEVGVSTDKLNELVKEVKKANEALDNHVKGNRKYELWEANPNTRPTATNSTSGWRNREAINDYNTWRKLKDKADKAKAKFDEEWSYLKGLEKKYSGYGDNMYDRISTGIAARQAHLGQQSLFYGLNADDASYTRLKNSLSRLGTVGASIVDAKSGKQVTGSDLNGTNGLLKDENTAIGVITEGDKVFLSLAGKGGKKYAIKGIRHIDDFNERLSYVNKKLGDFYSPRTTGNVYTVPAGFTGGLAEILEAARKAGKAEHPKETNMYAATVRMPLNGRLELVNIVSDGMGVYYQTLTDELYNKGEFREAVIQNAAATALVDLTPTLAHTLEAKENEK